MRPCQETSKIVAGEDLDIFKAFFRLQVFFADGLFEQFVQSSLEVICCDHQGLSVLRGQRGEIFLFLTIFSEFFEFHRCSVSDECDNNSAKKRNDGNNDGDDCRRVNHDGHDN
jgi:hypothetical protein